MGNTCNCCSKSYSTTTVHGGKNSTNKPPKNVNIMFWILLKKKNLRASKMEGQMDFFEKKDETL